MTPIAHSIKALEGQVSNAADVYAFWLTIAASLWDLFLYDDINKELARKVTTIGIGGARNLLMIPPTYQFYCFLPQSTQVSMHCERLATLEY